MTESAITIGKFDGIHRGHQLLIKDVVDVAQKREYKSICYKLDFGDSALMTSAEDEELLKGFGIDSIIRPEFTPEFAGMSHNEFVQRILVDELNVRYIAVGTDFRYGKDRIGNVDTLRQSGETFGFEVNVIDKLQIGGETVSSTRIRSCLEAGDVSGASELMGHPYKLTGEVATGKKLGRTLGYPTINLKYDERKKLPKYGVYASRVLVYDGNSAPKYLSENDASKPGDKLVLGTCKEYCGITNIGIRPTVDDGDKVTIETFIYDFDKDIYGSFVEVIPEKFIREEKKFSGLDELTAQIKQDITEAGK